MKHFIVLLIVGLFSIGEVSAELFRQEILPIESDLHEMRGCEVTRLEPGSEIRRHKPVIAEKEINGKMERVIQYWPVEPGEVIERLRLNPNEDTYPKDIDGCLYVIIKTLSKDQMLKRKSAVINKIK